MKQNFWYFLSSAILCTAFLLPAKAFSDDPKLSYEKYKLANGMEVILHQDNSVPLVAVDVWYHVGSGDEFPGKSGFAHLFEHMMFQGSQNTGSDVHFEILQKIGSSGVNGSTNSERTNYYEIVPSHQLETALWLESDRMGYMLPLLNEKSLANQRDVVRNERRQNYDTRPYSLQRFAVNKALYPEGHPYRYLTIGLHKDLESASLKDVTDFFKVWYVPANATLVLAGDFETKTAKALVEKWFGTFPKSIKPKRRDIAVTPIAAKKRETISDPLAKLVKVHYAWLSPALYEAGDAELDILASSLGGSTGRLYKRLVLQEQLTQRVAVYQSSAGRNGTFHIEADLMPGADMKKVESIIEEELQKVYSAAISQREFDRAVINFESQYIWGLESLLARAETLQSYNHFTGNPNFITQDLDRYRKSSPAKVKEITVKYLKEKNRIEIITVPGKGSKDGGAS